MKKLLLSLFFLILAAPLVPSVNAAAYSWDIPSIDADISIQKSGTIHVQETIVADFTRDEHHGIYRTIPVSYRDSFGTKFNLRFNLISVTDGNGNPQPIAEQSREGDSVYLKIGDPAVWLNKKTTYVITYEVNRAIGYFNDHDELYWNVFENWEVPVLASTATVHIPQGASKDSLKAVCYTGQFGSSLSDCTATVQDGQTFIYKGNTQFMPGEGLTIVAGFPTGLVIKPSVLQEIWWFVTDNWGAFIPIAVFLYLFLKWWFTGRDPKTKDTIIPRYEPPDGLTPTEVGTIIDERVDVQDISTVVIDYAVKGYLKIKEIKLKKLLFLSDTDYEIEKLKDYHNAPNIKSHELDILDSMFDGEKSVKISDLKYKYYTHLKDIKDKVYKNLVKDGYFAGNPETVRKTYLGVGTFLVAVPLFAAGVLIAFAGVTLLVSLIISGILFIFFSRIMPRKTLKGATAYFEIKGLEEYIRTAEKDRIKFQSDQNIFFEKLLPYAMVLGLADKWAEAFKDIYKGKPNWFESDNMTGFNTYYLVNRLSNFTTMTNTAFASSPRSSGGGSSAWGGGSGFSGGFSGGGFGGGGGGGW